jgi:uncharacterized protein
LTQRATARAELAGAQVDAVAVAAIRATREAMVRRGRQQLPCVLGVPIAGEEIAGEVFDGETEAAIFPGDLPDEPNELLRPHESFSGPAIRSSQHADLRFLRVRPPVFELSENGVPVLPHIRLDRALQFLIGDRLK